MDVVLTKIEDRHAYLATRELDDGSTMVMALGHQQLMAMRHGVPLLEAPGVLRGVLSQMMDETEPVWRSIPLEARREATRFVLDQYRIEP